MHAGAGGGPDEYDLFPDVIRCNPFNSIDGRNFGISDKHDVELEASRATDAEGATDVALMTADDALKEFGFSR